MRPTRTFYLLLALLMLVVLSRTGCIHVTNFSSPQAKFEATRTSTAPAAKAIEVHTVNGAVNVRRGDGTAETSITARLAATTQQRLDAARVMADVRSDGVLVVSVDWPGGKPLDNEACAFDVTVPASTAAGVTVRTSNGAIDVANLSGPARLESSNGRIHVAHHAGAVAASTTNGLIDLSHVAGDADAQTTNGAIELREIGGRATARTTNGKVTVALAPTSAGAVEARTTNGAADVTLPASYRGRVVVSTTNGGVNYPKGPSIHDVDAGDHHASFVVGEGAASSTVSTTNGSASVRLQ